MKKILLITLFLLTPALSMAQTPANTGPYTGLVKCDGVILSSDTDAAKRKKCDFIELVNQINFLVNWAIRFILLVTLALLAYTGGAYMYAGMAGDVSAANAAKGRLSNIFWGIIIMLFAWLVVRTALNWLIDPAFGGLDLLGK